MRRPPPILLLVEGHMLATTIRFREESSRARYIQCTTDYRLREVTPSVKLSVNESDGCLVQDASTRTSSAVELIRSARLCVGWPIKWRESGSMYSRTVETMILVIQIHVL